MGELMRDRTLIQCGLAFRDFEIVNTFDSATRAVVLERRLAEVEDLIVSMSLVDGAVVVNQDMSIRGFGAKLIAATDRDNESRQRELNFIQHPQWNDLPEDRRALSEFGTRHKSAVHFCEDAPGTVAVVLSQDGAMRGFWNLDGEVRAAEFNADSI